MKRLLLALFVLGFAPNLFAEDEITAIGYHGNWRVYRSYEGEGLVCYMATSPQHSNVKREDAFLTVTHRPYEKTYDTIAVMLGTSFHKKSRPTLEVDNQKVVEMKHSDDTAFVVDKKTEERLIQEMIIGNVARTKAKSTKGTILRDTYSLKGFGAAYKLLQQNCRPELYENDSQTGENK